MKLFSYDNLASLSPACHFLQIFRLMPFTCKITIFCTSLIDFEGQPTMHTFLYFQPLLWIEFCQYQLWLSLAIISLARRDFFFK
jgi:hypothetical protein